MVCFAEDQDARFFIFFAVLCAHMGAVFSFLRRVYDKQGGCERSLTQATYSCVGVVHLLVLGHYMNTVYRYFNQG